jgi:hypothetical protein
MKSAFRSQGVITLAYGNARYVEQARSLAHSLQLHAPHLPRTLITDSKNPEIRGLFTDVIPYRPEYGSGVRQKLFLDCYSPYEQTLFIDSDCLVLGNLEAFWSAFADQYFGVPGHKYLYKGSTHPSLDLNYVLETFQLKAIPKFNGGTYYFNRSPEATEFFETVRDILDKWRTFRICDFRRGGPNDEDVYALAMAVHHIGPTSMGSGGMWTPIGYKGPLLLDALRGTCSFEKEGMKLSPEIIHFPWEYANSFVYARERAKLRAHVEGKETSMSSLGSSFATSVLWHCRRRLRGLSKLARTSVQARRALRSI